MPRKKSKRKKRKQRGGGGPDDYSIKPQQRTYVDAIPSKKKRIIAKLVPVPSNSKGGLKEPLLGESVGLKKPLLKKKQSSSNNLKNIYEKGKNILQGFTFKDMLLWAVWFVAIVIYSISITKSSGSDLILWTYGFLLGCTLFISFAQYLSKKNKDSDVMSASWGILKTMIPLLSSIFGLSFIFFNYSSNLKTISIIGKYVEELSIFNNIIAFSSFLQVSRLISYFKSMGSKQTHNLFDYVIFVFCFIIQITITSIIFNKLESYATNC